MSGDLEASFGFTGYYQHAASGLSLALYRAFDARLGRFISRDPIAENGGINLYGYVNNSPGKFIDPLGLLNEPGSGIGGGGTLPDPTFDKVHPTWDDATRKLNEDKPERRSWSAI